jgi:hypothetical protein
MCRREKILAPRSREGHEEEGKRENAQRSNLKTEYVAQYIIVLLFDYISSFEL